MRNKVRFLEMKNIDSFIMSMQGRGVFSILMKDGTHPKVHRSTLGQYVIISGKRYYIPPKS